MPQDMEDHGTSQSYERLGDENMVVVRCTTCQDKPILGAYYYWPTGLEIALLKEEHHRLDEPTP